MTAVSDFLLPIVQKINMYLSDYILIFLLVGIGLFYTIRTRFVQVRCFGEGMKKVFGNIKFRGGKAGSGLSSFQALATAIAAQVGTGNIVGASGAILVGGPGAIFWMWVIAFFGMATIYAEAVLAQHTKKVNEDGSVEGGPVYYIKSAFKGGFGKFLAGFFAIATVISLGFIGGMVQSNSIGATINTAFGIPTWITGLVLAAIVAFIVIGGAQRIAATAEKIVPLMAVLYIVGSLVIIAFNIVKLPEAIAMIFKYAFQPQALIGGGIGYALKTAISQGAKRGLFSNEAGMGSTPHAHAMANVKKPHDQGVAAMMGVFLDTFVVLTMTALVVITCTYTSGGALAGDLTDEEISALASLADQGELERHFITDENECAVITKNGNVYKASENRSRTGFICKISVDEMKPSNTASFGGSKYEIFDARVTYAQAKAIAEAKGGALAEIDSENKAMMLSLLLKNSDKYFTGVQGTEKELRAVCDAFKDETEFSEENVAVLLNDGSRKLGVGGEVLCFVW